MLKFPPPGNEHVERDVRSREIVPNLPDGVYVFVQDEAGTVFVLPDEQKHQHISILGSRLPVKYAGDMEVKGGRVRTITNCSGTFQFNDREGLLEVAAAAEKAGLSIEPRAVRLFSWDETAAVEVLR